MIPFNSFENSKSYSVQRGEEAERVRQETERARQVTERAQEEAERAHEEAERQRQHELQMAELLNREGRRENERVNGRKSPKLPVFVNSKDDLRSYLQRFERFARVNNWSEEDWAVSLSALLTGQAQDVYSRLSMMMLLTTRLSMKLC